MKGVTGILDELSYRNGRPFDMSFDARVDCRDLLERAIVAGPDDRKRRMMKIIYRRGFAHEFRVYADAKVLPLHFAGSLLQ